MNTFPRCVVRVAVVWLLLTQASLLSAQQYDRGIVLDPVQPGNINRIFQREREAQYRSDSTFDANAETLRLTWSQRAGRAFRAGNYTLAENNWLHAILDEPQNGLHALRLGQAQFASGNFDGAADSIQMGMSLLPYQQWGLIVKNYKELYPNNQPFTSQLRVLEKARKENPDDPAIRFLLGYEYLYLGFPTNAETELKTALQLQPENPYAEKLMAIATGAPVGKLERATAPGSPPARTPAGGVAAPPKTPATPPTRPQINPPD